MVVAAQESLRTYKLLVASEGAPKILFVRITTNQGDVLVEPNVRGSIGALTTGALGNIL